MKAAFQWEERNISKLDTTNILEDDLWKKQHR